VPIKYEIQDRLLIATYSGTVERRDIVDHAHEIKERVSGAIVEIIKYSSNAELRMTIRELKLILDEIRDLAVENGIRWSIVFVRPDSPEILPYVDYILKNTAKHSETTWLADSLDEARSIADTLLNQT